MSAPPSPKPNAAPSPAVEVAMEGDPTPEGGTQRWIRIFNAVVLVLGLCALAWMIRKIGVSRIVSLIREIGWYMALVLALDLAITLCDAAAIHQLMRPEGRTVRFWRVFVAQSAGQAVNLVTPGGNLGEATKVTLLIGGHAPRTRVISAIVLFNLLNLGQSVAIIAIGIPITVTMLPFPPRIEIMLWIATAATILIAALIMQMVHKGMFASVLRTLRGLRLISQERSEKLTGKMAKLDSQLKMAQQAERGGLRAGFALLGLSRFLGYAQIAIVLSLLGADLSVGFMVAVVSAGMLIGWVSSIIPMGLGLTEGGNAVLFGLLGENQGLGVAFILVRRVRQVLFAALNFSLMFAVETYDNLRLTRAKASLRARMNDRKRAKKK